MPRVVFILGLCGAGKSFRAREFAAQGFANFDEKVTGRPVHPDRAQWPTSAYSDVLATVAMGRDCVVTEVYFYLPAAQQRVAEDLLTARPDLKIEWECFDATDLDVANYNCEHDPDRTADGVAANIEQNRLTVDGLRTGILRLPPGARLLKTRRRP